MNFLLAVGFCLLCIPSGGYSDATNTPLLTVLENALINNTHNLVALQSAFYPAKAASPSFLPIFIDDCFFVVKKIHQPYDDDPAFSNCSADCDVNSTYCLTNTKPVYLSDTTNSRLLHMIYSENLVDILKTVEFVSFELFDQITRFELGYQQPFDNEFEDFVVISFSIDELDVMPSHDDLWHSLELLLSWVGIIVRLPSLCTPIRNVWARL